MITSLLDADLDAAEQEWVEACREQQFMQEHPTLSRIKTFICWTIPCFLHQHITCKLFDHHIQMDGHAGPDSGYEDWWCDRCHSVGGHICYY